MTNQLRGCFSMSFASKENSEWLRCAQLLNDQIDSFAECQEACHDETAVIRSRLECIPDLIAVALFDRDGSDLVHIVALFQLGDLIISAKVGVRPEEAKPQIYEGEAQKIDNITNAIGKFIAQIDSISSSARVLVRSGLLREHGLTV